MDEFVQAHATYRFVLLDDEEEKPRILVRSPYIPGGQHCNNLNTLTDLDVQPSYASIIRNIYALVHLAQRIDSSCKSTLQNPRTFRVAYFEKVRSDLNPSPYHQAHFIT